MKTKGTTNELKADVQGNYASINGLEMYYEIHGAGQPLVLLHGAFSAIGTSFGKILPAFARSRQVIAFEQQAHGHTADIDRPLSIKHMADDTVAALRQIGIENADLFGYSMGAGIALDIAVRYPELVRKLVLASVTYNTNGFQPGFLEAMENLKIENMAGSLWQEEYARIAPHPEDWPTLFAKMRQLNQHLPDLVPEDIQSIKAPTLLIIGDADIARPEHAAEMYRLLGGGTPVDATGLSRSQFAVLPGTTHVMVVERADWLVSMIGSFLDAPIPGAE